MTESIEVWLAEDDASIRWVLERALQQAGMRHRSFDNVEAVVQALRSAVPAVLVTDIRMPGRSGLELLQHIRSAHPDLPVIVTTAHSDLENAVAAYKGGAFEYLPKPFDVDRAIDLIHRAAQQTNAVDATAGEYRIPEILGSAPAMQQVFRMIGRLSRSSMTVLITGESGSGKELVARALHRHGPRAEKAFIALNTSAFTAELLESELFGHEKGAFTGAEAQRRGRFEQADGGTLFLDEIGDMSAALQTRLLRVLAEGEFYRVGGQARIQVDVRVIAATHQDLNARVNSGEFREDLLHRLNVIRIDIPPLRDRREDIPDLLRHYLSVAAGELGIAPKTMSPAAERLLMAYHWPGNVRELVNACRRLTALAAGRLIEAADLPADFAAGGAESEETDEAAWSALLARWADRRLQNGASGLLQDALPQFERTLIKVALARANGLRQEAAKLLGWGRNTLARKLRELKME